MTNHGHCIACGLSLTNPHGGDPLYAQDVWHCPTHGPVATREQSFGSAQPAPSPAPLPSEVEEAMEVISEAIVFLPSFNAPNGQIMFLRADKKGYRNADARTAYTAALAVIKSALAKGVEWERRYAELVEDVSRRTDQARTMEAKL